ncbi:low temperature requirement protein A [Kocuria soli]|uniref:Low temperature requirement protein A n=1 Tax=Kocuria soli TaxID=2485125 RepID=A0A3N3ZP42_9MICC|nr:low temperature requirement protein A [Kocuria soli]
MRGRDPHESGRVASSLELLFDLTFVVAFGIAGNEFPHMAAEGEILLASAGYVFVLFAVIWSWINYTWFASAFDTDDWAYRLVTMVIMCGVVVLALGIPPFFDSLHHGHVDNTVMVMGYVVMRIGMALHWGWAYLQAPEFRAGARIYLATLLAAQVGWVILALAHTSLRVFVLVGLTLLVVELGGPFLGERVTTQREGQGSHTPWHPHHLAERYGLLTIITLGEGVVGTVAALSPMVEEAGGWSLDSVLVVIAGIGLTLAIWWLYFSVDWGTLLHAHPTRCFGWGYGHIVLFMAIAAVGAGLHVAGYVLNHEAHRSGTLAVASVAVPVLAFILTLMWLYGRLTRTFDAVHIAMVEVMVILLVGALGMAAAEVPMGWCLLVAMAAPAVAVVLYETVGHRHQERLFIVS